MGRKLSSLIGIASYAIFFIAGFMLYAAVPFASSGGMVFLFVLLLSVIITMYGGGFSTIPAYLAEPLGLKRSDVVRKAEPVPEAPPAPAEPPPAESAAS